MSRGSLRLAGAILPLVFLAAVRLAPAHAQDIEPRSFSNAPVGVNFLIGGYAYTRGGLAFDSASQLSNPQLTTKSAVAGYARVLDLWGMSGKFDAVVPYTWLSGTADFRGEQVERVVNGLMDPRFRLSMNFYGAPALSLPEFRNYQQDLIVGASLQVSVPAGQYDETRIVNLGANRWFFKPELGVSKALGPWTVEGTVAATIYTDNKDFFNGSTRSQKAIYSTQAHAIYGFDSGVWVSLDATYFTGGAYHAQRRAGGRPAEKLAPGRYACASRGPPQLDQVLRQQRGLGAYRQQLRPVRGSLAAPLGRRAVMRAPWEA